MILDYLYNSIYTILYPYVTLYNVAVFSSIVLVVLVFWIFWGSIEARNKVFQVLGKVNSKWKS